MAYDISTTTSYRIIQDHNKISFNKINNFRAYLVKIAKLTATVLENNNYNFTEYVFTSLYTSTISEISYTIFLPSQVHSP